MIPTKSNFKSFHGVLMVLSIVASFLAFQDFATPAQSRYENTRTEWVSSHKITKRTTPYDAIRCDAHHPESPFDYSFVELNYSRKIKTALACIIPPPDIPCRNVPEKTVAGLSNSHPTHQG